MSDIADLAGRVLTHFEQVEADVFRGDPVANPRLKVEVLDPELVDDTPTLVLVTPWTLNGMAFPPNGAFPETITINKKRYPVFRNDLPGIGAYCSINLVADVSTLQSPEAARGVGRPLGALFREAVARFLAEDAVADSGRRDLLRRRGAD